MEDLPVWIPKIAVTLMGLAIGSFLNVCIVRLPRDQSIVTPRSRCPHCGTPIAWYHNIPLASFLWLRGRCASCRAPIGWRYPVVEALTAGLALAVYDQFPTPLAWGLWFFLFVAPLIAMTFIDLEHQIIPDLLSLSGIPMGWGVQMALARPGHVGEALLTGVIGSVIGGGFLLIIGTLYEKLRKQEGLGGGDVKLAAMLGAFLGWKGVMVVLLISAGIGSVVGVAVVLVTRSNLRLAIPYGPFLAAAALIYLFWGEVLLDWYLGFFLR
ncbi:MAG: prepilin peptidase [Deltaproteobacteria bacterium]|nr:prepilin peptidase [Deltaproteobacteria bacterium]